MTDPTLEQAILDATTWDAFQAARLVYADWLEEHGQPRDGAVKVRRPMPGRKIMLDDPADWQFQPKGKGTWRESARWQIWVLLQDCEVIHGRDADQATQRRYLRGKGPSKHDTAISRQMWSDELCRVFRPAVFAQRHPVLAKTGRAISVRATTSQADVAGQGQLFGG